MKSRPSNSKKGGHSCRFGLVLPKRSTLASRSRFLGNQDLSNTNPGNRGWGPDPGKSAVWARFVAGFGNSRNSTVGSGKCVSADRRSTQKSGRGLQRETAFGSGRESQKAKLARPPEGKSPDFEKHAQNSAQMEIRHRNDETSRSKQP